MKRSVVLYILLGGGVATAQNYVISTFAGGDPPLTPVPGLKMAVNANSVATDSSGNLYFISSNCVFKQGSSGAVTRIAGDSRQGDAGDGGPALTAEFRYAGGLAVDSAGYIYVADSGNHRIRVILPSGIISTWAGTGVQGFAGDGGDALKAQFLGLGALAVNSQRNLYAIDGARIRKVARGIVTTVAGAGTPGYSGDGGPALAAEIFPSAIAADNSGNLYIAEDSNLRIRKVKPDGAITTVAGNGSYGFSGDGGPATSAQITGAAGIAVDVAGNVYISDTSVEGNSPDCECVRKLAGGVLSTVIPNLQEPSALTVDGGGNLYIATPENNGILRRASAGSLSLVVGSGNAVSFADEGGPAVNAQMNWPTGVAIDSQGNIYYSDTFNNRVRMVSPNGTVTTIAGTGTSGFSGDGGPAAQAWLYYPVGLALDSHANLFIADHGNSRIRKVSQAGIISTFATAAAIGATPTSDIIWSLAIDKSDNLYVLDPSHNQIRKIAPDGTLTTMAGNGTQGLSGDGGPATSAEISLTSKSALTTDGLGNLYFTNDGFQPPPLNPPSTSSPRIRKVSPDGAITTVAGDGTAGFSGDGGEATAAALGSQLDYPIGLAADASGNFYIADGANQRIRMVTQGIIQTIAGTGTFGYTGDGGPATSAQLWGPSGLAVDGGGNVYIADANNNAIRLLQRVSAGIAVTGIVNSASGIGGAIAPGEIVVISGTGLGPAQLTVNTPGNGFYSAALAGATVKFNGVPAPLVYTWATQVAAVVPYAVGGSSAEFTVSYQGRESAVTIVPVTAAAPGIYTVDSSGKGQALALNADGSLNSASNPAKAGDAITIFATGGGQMMPVGPDGLVASAPLAQPVVSENVELGGFEIAPDFAGDAEGEISGLLKITFTIPKGVAAGSTVPIVLEVGSDSQAGVTIAIGSSPGGSL